MAYIFVHCRRSLCDVGLARVRFWGEVFNGGFARRALAVVLRGLAGCSRVVVGFAMSVSRMLLPSPPICPCARGTAFGRLEMRPFVACWADGCLSAPPVVSQCIGIHRARLDSRKHPPPSEMNIQSGVPCVTLRPHQASYSLEHV